MSPTLRARPPMQLTPRQRQILEAISGFQQSRCCSPTLAELARGLGISRSTVFEHIEELRSKGLLVTCPGRARSSTLTSLSQELLEGLERNGGGDPGKMGGSLPLVGQVAAGRPVEAVEDREELSWQTLFGRDSDLFSLQVKGDSMIDDGVHSGDYVICRRTCVARDGDMVVAMVGDGEATLKRLYRDKDRVRLEPANNQYAPIYAKDCRIEAVVVGLVRRL